MRYEILDISGDIGIKALGRSCEEAFISAGIAMYSLITDIEKVDEKQHLEVAVESDSLEGALVRYLNELIFQFDTYGFIGRRIEIIASELLTPNPQLKIIVYGEEFDAEKHDRKLLVKAATYHNIKVQKTDDIWEIEVIFDI